jgi:hypothetical protein
MKRIVSVIERKSDGKLVIRKDREQIECDDNHAGMREIIEDHKSAGGLAVYILLEDGSVGPHWTKPVPETPAS